ncbi:hypothetical protein MLD38_035887 [Melastoma candidum]|uniref:Uncharacterized protein n=1 Tax=Melastoma candidum TaxID=119954 RepID=A0ACB9LHH3_9MYRT|nr:hypothetical protein MLD38_035887 [Melastoma candidum]
MISRMDAGDAWKDKAYCLHQRLRSRFRIAVVHWHCRCLSHPAFSDRYSPSSIVQRWLQRFRDFRCDSLPSSSSFYRKTVGREFNEEEESLLLRMVQAITVPVLGNMCHVFMHGLNHVQVYGLEKLHKALLHRPKDKALITVSNHVASVDDPFVIASLLPPSVLMDARNLRWTLCATDRCFKNPVTSAFFRSVRVLPVSRGDGIYQKGMDMAISKLNRGGWVHIFPEGSRSRDGGKTLGSPKRGVGRLVLDADNIPLVIPFVHTGMQDIMPIGANLPRIGKTVIVVVGDPLDFDDVILMEESQHITRGHLYDAVSSRIGHTLQELKLQADRLALEQSLAQLHGPGQQNSERAARILQLIDWESLGATHESSPDQFPSTKKESHLQQEPDLKSTGEHHNIGLAYEGGIMSRMRGLVDPSELMGFAARGLFINSRPSGCQEETPTRGPGPLTVWKQYIEANLMRIVMMPSTATSP